MVVKLTNGTRAAWLGAHEALSKLARTRAAADFEEGRCLLAALRARVHVHLGMGSFAEYVGRFFGYSPRSTQEKLRVAEALERLPKTRDALARGAFNWSVIRELTRVGVPETEAEWLEAARGKTVKEVEALVNGRAPGDRPDSPVRPEVRRHVLRFEVSGETLASFREAMMKLRRESDGPLDDDSALLLMARYVLQGPSDAGRASYQIALTVCEACGAGAQRGCGELVPVPPEVVEMAECDAQVVEMAECDAQVVEMAECDPEPAADPKPDSRRDRARAGAARPKRRATKSIPQAVRRKVVHRDHGRCVVPGCRHATFVDAHHVVPRADGGKHEAGNLVVLCAAHHRAVHKRRLIITGRVDGGLGFQHRDGTPYGRLL